MSEINKDTVEDDEAYLIMPPKTKQAIVQPETVWAKIGEDGELEVIRWDIIELYATEYDAISRANQEKSQSHIICKLLVLVRDQVRKEWIGNR